MLTTNRQSQLDDEGDSSDEEKIVVPKKLKADTDHKNHAFAASLRQRTIAASVTDF